jgi:Phytanoyl-CoA dioxygenase (PhyH)
MRCSAPTGGGGPVALAGSHRLVSPYLGGGEAFRMGRVRASLAAHPWLRGWWERESGDDGEDRTRRYLYEGAAVDGVPLRVMELTGEPGDVVLMHCDTFHAAAPNRSAEPRMMLTGMIDPRPGAGAGPGPDPGPDSSADPGSGTTADPGRPLPS